MVSTMYTTVISHSVFKESKSGENVEFFILFLEYQLIDLIFFFQRKRVVIKKISWW